MDESVDTLILQTKTKYYVFECVVRDEHDLRNFSSVDQKRQLVKCTMQEGHTLWAQLEQSKNAKTIQRRARMWARVVMNNVKNAKQMGVYPTQ
jgi:hypothetical protein